MRAVMALGLGIAAVVLGALEQHTRPFSHKAEQLRDRLASRLADEHSGPRTIDTEDRNR